MGLFWALGCIWLIYTPIKMPHVKGESYTDLNSSYVHVYTDYLPVEFFCNGIISACLTFINVMCIFITAILVLKIKEVAAPYTSTPELRRFWEHDIRLVRDKNNSTANSWNDSRFYDGLSTMKHRALERTLNEAVREAINDETFRKVQRLSYGQHRPDEIVSRLGLHTGSIGLADGALNDDTIVRVKDEHSLGGISRCADGVGNVESTTDDLAALDRLITYLLGQPSGNLENWRRSRRASARGYRHLRPNVETLDIPISGMSTTPM